MLKVNEFGGKRLMNATNGFPKYKYVHLHLMPNVGFNLNLIEMICDKNNGFDVQEHIFVTACKELYDLEKDKCNIEYCEGPKHNGVEMINLYGDWGGYYLFMGYPLLRFFSI